MLPELGAGISAFETRCDDGLWRPLMRPSPPAANWFNDLSCYVLAPWSNRIARGTFRFRGSTYTVTPDWPDGTAIHGDLKSLPWTILDRSPVSARFTINLAHARTRRWPWAFEAHVRYELGTNGLLTRLTIRNLDNSPFPAGLGFHPFWMRRVGNSADALITMRTRGRYPARNMLPTGPPVMDEISQRFMRPADLGNLLLDDVFGGFDGSAAIEWPGASVRVAFDCSPNARHAVLYAPPDSGSDGFFCLEPVTMVNDGFNLANAGHADTGVTVLNPGESLSLDWNVRVSWG